MNPSTQATRITLRVLLILFLAWIFMTLRYYLLMGFGVWVIVTALDPMVTKLEKHKIPRSLSSIIILLSILLFLIWMLSVIIPPLFIQLQALVQNLPQVTERAINTVSFWGQQNIDTRIHPLLVQIADRLSQQLVGATGDLIRLGQSVVSGIFTSITFVVITLYLLIEYPRLADNIIRLFPPEQQDHIKQKITIINLRLGGWARGQIILIFAVGAVTWFSLSLLQIPFALPLGILAGILEIIPMVGPLLSMIPAIIVALAISPLKALSTIILYFFIQQLENNLLVPQIMEHTSGLDPLVVIIILTLGGKLLGMPGILVSIPATIVAWTLIEDHLLNRYPPQNQ